jgi:hypothetical protein
MPKKNKKWLIGMPKGPIGPFVWHVWVKGSKRPIRMTAFDQEHVKDQLEDRLIVKVVKQPEEKDEYSMMPLGPKGSTVNRPADYDAGFKILRAWIDQNGGPPEEIRIKLRELYIDYDRAERKTTTYSQKKNGRHKI